MSLQRFLKIRSQTAMDNPIEFTDTQVSQNKLLYRLKYQVQKGKLPLVKLIHLLGSLKGYLKFVLFFKPYPKY